MPPKPNDSRKPSKPSDPYGHARSTGTAGSDAPPTSVHEVTERNVMLIAEIEALEKSNQTLTERAVDAVTRFCGSIQFVWVNVFGYSLWIGLNQTHVLRLDHAPYSLLGLIIALEAILLSTFILMTENRQQKLSERRNHLNLQMTLLAEQQNTMILQMLLSIQSRLGIHDEQETTAVMLESAEPSNVIQQIQEIIEGDEKAQTSVS